MQPPITIGTVLQNRYRIIQILGQGGFGRTYLAEDPRRFNEHCAIKELITTTTGAFVSQKAQELFEREAAILYQIEHPQVPKFRERFEQDQRLFLVEDYVAGKTYRTILSQRQAVGQTLTETEVLQLMRFLLPVLGHIHNLGIIHRDISPENIILRDSDAMPVLIDFGVVKELATRLLSPDSTASVTTVGKLGYAPSEQMQTGRAYPSSDLYALAVTAIVLLTGREPTDLFDETQLTWNWQRWTRVNPRFAEIINRMLIYIPGDRYQSAADVLQALQSVDQPNVPAPELSNVQTIAVGRRPDELPPHVPNKPNPVIPPSQNSSVLDNPLAVGVIGTAVIILAGFGSWSLVSSIRSQSKAPPETPPQTFPSPVIAGGTTPTPTSTLTPTPTSTLTPTSTPTSTNGKSVLSSKRLNLEAYNPTKVDGTLTANQVIEYSFSGKKGLKLSVLFEQENGILLTLLDANQKPIDSSAEKVKFYEGTLPLTGKYIMQLTLSPEVGESDYSLSVSLENPVEPTPTETPIQTPTPTPTPKTSPTSTPTATPTEKATETPTPTPTDTANEEENKPPDDTTSQPDFTPKNSP